MKKLVKPLRALAIILLLGATVYFAARYIEERQAYRQNAIDYSRAISELLIETSPGLPETTTVSQTDVSTPHASESTSEVPTDTSTVDTSTDTATDATSAPPETTTETTPGTTKSIWPTFTLNWNAIYRTNPEIIGWIWAYDTTISFPLLQAEDNVKYLTTTYNGQYGSLGSIFLDYRVKPDFTARNTIIYGHNGNHGVMFGALTFYLKASYLRSHPYFCIMTKDGLKKYEVFSVYRTDAYSDTFSLYFQSDAHFAGYLEKIVSRSLFDTGVSVSADDLIVTLSTCTNNPGDKNERVVVHGRLMTN